MRDHDSQADKCLAWYFNETAMFLVRVVCSLKIVFSKHNEVEFATHCCDVIMGAMASQITSLTLVYSAVYSGTDQRKHQSSASLAFVQRIHRWPVNSPHKWPVTRKMFPFDDVIMIYKKKTPGPLRINTQITLMGHPTKQNLYPNCSVCV